ncbi:Uncharacterised protein [Mycobacteroides abscessus subsp. abscessus]|nr:Uncharacterised protein [Mycobacteroides abscessus subsp. abscessus]
MTKCACVWTTSGRRVSRRRAISGFVSHGMQIVHVGWSIHLWEVRRWTVTPFSTLTDGVPVADGQATWTSLPRAARPAASRSANFAAPLTSGA